MQSADECAHDGARAGGLIIRTKERQKLLSDATWPHISGDNNVQDLNFRAISFRANLATGARCGADRRRVVCAPDASRARVCAQEAGPQRHVPEGGNH